jgi:transposase
MREIMKAIFYVLRAGCAWRRCKVLERAWPLKPSISRYGTGECASQ